MWSDSAATQTSTLRASCLPVDKAELSTWPHLQSLRRVKEANEGYAYVICVLRLQCQANNGSHVAPGGPIEQDVVCCLSLVGYY
jgi:hypothetical protein